jgi:tetratricopeptide (TPR) repeat protein
VLKDTAALLILSLVTILLFAVTHILFGLYNRHQIDVAENWTQRGIQALQLHRPEDAVSAFRSALPYATDEHKIRQLLAEALAAAGRSDEATAYYRTLWEKEPGNGPINLALARLAIQRGNDSEAWTYYHAALDGTWNGDGVWRRPIVRLELAEYLIQKKHLDQARSELLIAAGNANEDVNLRLRIASLMEQAQDYTNALSLYRKVLQHNPAQLPALEGAGRTAYERGNYLLARGYLERASNHPDFPKESEDQKEALRNELRDSIHILLFYPSWNLPLSERARRFAEIERVTEDRLSSCMADFESKNEAIPNTLNDLSTQWSSLPPKRTPLQIASDGALAERILGLSYQVEQQTAKTCGQPTGEDLLLLKIATAPQSVEAQ